MGVDNSLFRAMKWTLKIENFAFLVFKIHFDGHQEPMDLIF